MITKKFKIAAAIMLLLAAITGIFQSCGSPSANQQQEGGQLSGNISISGAFALYPLTVKWAEEFQKVNPGVRIDISAGGAGKGMADALSGMIDLGMFSRGVSQAEADKGAWWIAVTKDAVLPTINAQNPHLKLIKEKGFSRETFVEVFLTQKIKTWGEALGKPGITDAINVYTRSDACGAAQMWGEYLGKDQESLQGIGVFGDPGIASAVKGDAAGLGFNNVIYAYDVNSRNNYDGLEVLPVDVNNNGIIDPEENFYNTLDEIMAAIRDGKYPSPPARDLYFVSFGKPQKPVVVAFLKWILSDGQKYVNEAGYVELSNEKVAGELIKLN
jgi:phosphate transport system substrate-binding protein